MTEIRKKIDQNFFEHSFMVSSMENSYIFFFWQILPEIFLNIICSLRKITKTNFSDFSEWEDDKFGLTELYF